MTTYQNLKNIILPQLENFQDDLLVVDRNILANYKGRFLYGVRKNGTNLLKLDSSSFDYFNESASDIEKKIQTSLMILTHSNERFYYFNGETIEEINREELYMSFSFFNKEVFYKKEKIDLLKIDELAFALFSIMFEEKDWKKVILNSSDSLFKKIKKNFDISSICFGKSFNDLKKQMIANYSQTA